MSTETTSTGIPPDLLAELREAADRAAKGLRDFHEARQAAQAVDRVREQNRRRFGEQAIGVAIIREFRGSLPE